MDLGPHAAFIWASYGIVVLTLGGLIAWLIADGVRLRRRLEEFDARGAGRGSRG